MFHFGLLLLIQFNQTRVGSYLSDRSQIGNNGDKRETEVIRAHLKDHWFEFV